VARRYVRGDSKLRRQIRRWPEELRKDLRMVMTSAGAELRDTIWTNAPKDEGDMADQVMYRVSRDGLSVQIGYSKRSGFKRAWKAGGFKALFQEYGTRHHGAQPFVGPAFREKLASILNHIDAAVNRTIRRASNI
jgi:HK97 gp10 family phage protein